MNASEIPLPQLAGPGLDEAATAAPGPDVPGDILWLVRLRWLAVGGVVIALAIARLIDWEPTVWRPALVAAALAFANLLTWWLYRRGDHGTAILSLRWQIFLQLLVDLVALAFLVEWTGGIANPFLMFVVFPVSIGAITLDTRKALLLGGAASLLFTGLVFCARASRSARAPFDSTAVGLDALMQEPAYVAGLLIAATMTLFGIVYFLRTVVARHELAEAHKQHHARIAMSRERMARVGMIATGVAHSVRNPLHGVLNCLDLLRTSRGPAEMEATLGLMEEGLSRIEQVTSRLLSLSRESPLRKQPVDLDALVTDTLRLLEVRAARAGIALRTELGGVPELRIDPVRIQEALFNILDNAIAAVVEARQTWVLVRTRRVEQPFPGVALEVEDPGIGVAEADAAHVFDPFFSTKPVGEGTGLGLAIAKEVVEAHDGDIAFTSRPRAGTQVRILLPIQAPAAPPGGAT
ncbi:MAG: ATP-binding protein [Planctomycetota bacterium]